MSQTVITIVARETGALNSLIEKRAADAIKSAGVERMHTAVLAREKAVDFIIDEANPALTKALFQKLQNLGVFDIFIQPADGFRKKRLLLADMDATIVETETLDELAAHFNLKDKVAPITAQAMRGEIDFKEALRMRVALLKGMPLSALADVLDETRYSKGADTLVKTMNRYNAKCVLISGGFDFFTRHVAATLGFYKNFGNTLGVNDDKLDGNVLPPIIDKDFKKKTLLEETAVLSLDIKSTLSIGDGANDIPMLQAAGVGVGYFGKPAVQEATTFQIRHTDLTSVLFLQGYRSEEFA